MCVCVFSGQDGGYGLESEEVILTPEDENPLRRILQVRTPALPPLLRLHRCKRTSMQIHTHTDAPQTKHSRVTQPHCVTLDVGILPVSRSAEAKHPGHPHIRGTLLENSCAASADSPRASVSYRLGGLRNASVLRLLNRCKCFL